MEDVDNTNTKPGRQGLDWEVPPGAGVGEFMFVFI